MKTAALAGVVLGLLIVAWTCVMGFTGWYKHPTLNYVFGLVALYQVVVLIVALARTRGERGYGGQVVVGLVASTIAAAFAFGGSILFTTVLFPTYFDDLRAMARAQGLSEAEIAQAATLQTPLANALAGAVGTIVTGLLVSLIAAIFLRKKR